MPRLTDLKNIGREMESKLKSVGIETVEELMRVGSKEAFLRLKTLYPHICPVHLYTLEGAILNEPYNLLPTETKAELKAFCDSLKIKTSRGADGIHKRRTGGEKSENAVEVAAALIWDKDRFLICKRPANKARGRLWEFAGGKTERGETKEQALIRECREELAITVEPRGVFTEVTHRYSDITVHLTLFDCVITAGRPQLLEHEDVRWITASEISEYEFCPADKVILEKIKSLR